MPPRIARSSVQIAAPKTTKPKPRNKRNLDAYAIASASTPPDTRVKPGRLGEYLDDGPKHKRRRAASEDEDEDNEEADMPPRRRTKLADEDVEEGSDSSGNEWTLGGLAEDDEDSEVDSDEAFGESDEERFEGFVFRGSKSGVKNKMKKGSSVGRRKSTGEAEGSEDGEEIDLEEVGSDDDFGDEGVDLATMLDEEDDEGSDEEMAERELHGGRPSVVDIIGQDGDQSDEEDNDESDDNVSESPFDEDDEDDNTADEERTARMQDRIEALNASTLPQTSQSARPRKALTVSEFGLVTDASAKKQLKTRQKSSPHQAAIPAPLPTRQQNKINREIATQKAKEQLDRWRDTVIQNRRAEFLSFPLQDPDQARPVGKDRFVVDDAPRNELEESIAKIMQESGMQAEEAAEEAIVRSEELGTNKLPVEEVLRRRAELRRTRDLLFREERKAKRIAKIKSKSYRRLHRRERQRQRELERGLLAEEDGGEGEKERAERKRAEARMSTRHADSKWARALKETNRGVWDEGARESVVEEAGRKEELRRRIAGDEGSDESSHDDDDDLASDQDEEAAMSRKLASLREDAGTRKEGEEKGLAGLKFMRAANERQRARNEEDMESLRKEMAIADGEEDGSEVEDQGLGRAIFGPKRREKKKKEGSSEKIKRPEMEEGEEESLDEEDEDVDVVTEKAEPARRTAAAPIKSKAPNGSFTKPSTPSAQPGGQTDGLSSWLTAPLQSRKERKRLSQRDAGAIIDTSTPVIQAKKPARAKDSATKSEPAQDNSANADKTDGWTVVTYNNNNNTDQEDSEAQAQPTDPILSAAEQKTQYHRRAFAADDVAAQTAFSAEKAALEEEDELDDGPSNANNNMMMPGWGSWTGAGLSKSIRRANDARQKAAHNPLRKSQIATRDKGREDVIISAKSTTRRSGKGKGYGYLADQLPHGFETREQYERSLRVPVGPEWTTKEVFQRATRPRVVVGRGRVVGAMERPLV